MPTTSLGVNFRCNFLGVVLKPWRNKAERLAKKFAGEILREICQQVSEKFAGPKKEIHPTSALQNLGINKKRKSEENRNESG